MVLTSFQCSVLHSCHEGTSSDLTVSLLNEVKAQRPGNLDGVGEWLEKGMLARPEVWQKLGGPIHELIPRSLFLGSEVSIAAGPDLLLNKFGVTDVASVYQLPMQKLATAKFKDLGKVVFRCYDIPDSFALNIAGPLLGFLRDVEADVLGQSCINSSSDFRALFHPISAAAGGGGGGGIADCPKSVLRSNLFIPGGRPRALLVHCSRGISRSATFAICLCMFYLFVSIPVGEFKGDTGIRDRFPLEYRTLLKLLQKKRLIYPNVCFGMQLEYLGDTLKAILVDEAETSKTASSETADGKLAYELRKTQFMKVLEWMQAISVADLLKEQKTTLVRELTELGQTCRQLVSEGYRAMARRDSPLKSPDYFLEKSQMVENYNVYCVPKTMAWWDVLGATSSEDDRDRGNDSNRDKTKGDDSNRDKPKGDDSNRDKPKGDGIVGLALAGLNPSIRGRRIARWAGFEISGDSGEEGPSPDAIEEVTIQRLMSLADETNTSISELLASFATASVPLWLARKAGEELRKFSSGLAKGIQDRTNHISPAMSYGDVVASTEFGRSPEAAQGQELKLAPQKDTKKRQGGSEGDRDTKKRLRT